jgi:hypothetical protein
MAKGGQSGWSNTYTGIPAYDTGQLAQRAAGTQAGEQWANTPLMQNPFIAQGVQGLQNTANAGNLGLSALSGDQGAYSQLSNPYQQSVLDMMQKQFGFQNQGVLNAAADQAQGQNAYGGARSDLLQGSALSQNQMGQSQQYGNTLLQGYNDTMNRAGGLAGLGQGANQGLLDFGNKDAAHQFAGLAATYGAYPHSTQTLTTGEQQGAQPNGAAKAGGTVMQLLPLLAAFA